MAMMDSILNSEEENNLTLVSPYLIDQNYTDFEEQ